MAGKKISEKKTKNTQVANVEGGITAEKKEGKERSRKLKFDNLQVYIFRVLK